MKACKFSLLFLPSSMLSCISNKQSFSHSVEKRYKKSSSIFEARNLLILFTLYPLKFNGSKLKWEIGLGWISEVILLVPFPYLLSFLSRFWDINFRKLLLQKDPLNYSITCAVVFSFENTLCLTDLQQALNNLHSLCDWSGKWWQGSDIVAFNRSGAGKKVLLGSVGDSFVEETSNCEWLRIVPSLALVHSHYVADSIYVF